MTPEDQKKKIKEVFKAVKICASCKHDVSNHHVDELGKIWCDSDKWKCECKVN